MHQKWSNGLRNLVGFLLVNQFLGVFLLPLEKGHPISLLETSITSAVELLLSLLLFCLIWRSPRLEPWEVHMGTLATNSGCFAGSYLGWVYAPTWGLLPQIGHGLGFLVGAMLGAGVTVLEIWIIFLKRKPLPTEQHSALDA
jgi:hypothetical protein